MQHDTSPHRMMMAGRPITGQCAGLVLAFSRRLFIQYYPRFTRFEAKHFLLEAARFMDGCCPVCVIDNTSVIVAAGAGADAVIAPEMLAFACTLGFGFRAHRVGHPDRKGRIERPFAYVEGNFLPARSFDDFADLNRQALAWCRDVANRKPKRVLGMSPDAAYLIEKPHLQPLPVALPPVYEVLERVVDLHGYVSVDANRYSVPERFVGLSVTVYKYPADIRICRRGTEIARHPRLIGQRDARHTLAEHHPTPAKASCTPALEDKLLRGDHQSLERYAAALKQHAGGRGLRALRRPLEMKRSYPSGPFLAAVEKALHFGLFDLPPGDAHPAAGGSVATRAQPHLPPRSSPSAVAVDARHLPVRTPARHQQGADQHPRWPCAAMTTSCSSGRHRQDRNSPWAPARSLPQRLPRPLLQCPDAARRALCLAGRSLHGASAHTFEPSAAAGHR
jgi:hypothetical protein